MGVKRILFSISIGILLLGSVLFLPLSPVVAQGTCSCEPNSNNGCQVKTDGCFPQDEYTPQCKPSLCTTNITGITNCTCILKTVVTAATTTKTPYITKLCDSVQNDEVKRKECVDCMNSKKMWTAIGCVPTTTEGFVNTLLPFFIGIGGGIAFLLILFGALQIMMSSGNPEKLNAGKELISAAITGLLLIIFSIFILQLIGVQILKIPGFS